MREVLESTELSSRLGQFCDESGAGQFFTHLTSETSSAGLNQHLSSDKQPSGNRDQLYPLQNRTVGTGTMFVGFKFNEWHCHYGTINNPSIMLVFVKDDAKTAGRWRRQTQSVDLVG